MFNYKNAKIRTKLLTGFMLLAAIATFVNAINAFQLAQIRDMQQRLFSQSIKPMEKLVALTEAFQKMRVASRDINLAKTPEAFEKGNSLRKENFRIVNESLTTIAAESPDSKTAVNNLRDSITHFNTILDTIAALALSGKSEEGNSYGRTPEVANTVKSCTEQLAALTASIISHGNGNTEKTISITNSALILSMICAVGMLLLAIILGILITLDVQVF
jgi:methyl-accepting chemotaxis protein